MKEFTITLDYEQKEVLLSGLCKAMDEEASKASEALRKNDFAKAIRHSKDGDEYQALLLNVKSQIDDQLHAMFIESIAKGGAIKDAK